MPKSDEKLWGKPYNEKACRDAWHVYYENFGKYTQREAAQRAGIGVAEMICYALDNGLIIPGDKSDAQSGLKKLGSPASA